MDSSAGAIDLRAQAALEVPLQRALGAELIDLDAPTAGVRFPVSGLAVTPAGTLHAAALSAIVELAGYLAVLPTLEPNEHAVTTTISTQHLRAGPSGEWIQLSGTLIKRARTLAFITVMAQVAGTARIVAHSQLTKSIVALKPDRTARPA